jgi:hypothetical protein
MTRHRLLLCIPLTFLAVACATQPRTGGLKLAEEVEFDAADGQVSFQLEPGDGEIEVENGAGDRLAGLRLEGDHIEITDDERRPMGSVVRVSAPRPGFRVLDPDGRTTVVSLRREPDGDLIVEDAAGERLYIVKQRDYGFKTVDRRGKLENKVRVKDSKVSVRDASGDTYLSTRDPISPEAVAVMVLDDVRFGHAVALGVAVAHWGFEGLGEQRAQADLD